MTGRDRRGGHACDQLGTGADLRGVAVVAEAARAGLAELAGALTLTCSRDFAMPSLASTLRYVT